MYALLYCVLSLNYCVVPTVEKGAQAPEGQSSSRDYAFFDQAHCEKALTGKTSTAQAWFECRDVGVFITNRPDERFPLYPHGK